jgi:peptidyl-prolyl cis-trans isomerase D
MLEKIREGSQGIVAKIIIGLIILTFALAGVSSYLTSGNQPVAATVNGVEISVNALERAYQNQRARMESQYGEAFGQLLSDSAYLKSFRSGILEQLIGDELSSQFAQQLGVRVSDEQIKKAILDMQEFQVDGQFNNDRYIALLGQAGYSPTSFKDYLRDQMSRQQVVSAIAGSEFALTEEAKVALTLQQQTRDIRHLTIAAKDFSAGVELSDEAKQTYYQQNIEQYDTDEQVKVSYVELKLSDLVAKQSVDNDAIASYYDDNIVSYQTEVQIKASHILVEFGDDSAAAKVKAEALLEQLTSGSDFAALAKMESADTFSAENGGDLDWFAKGAMDPAFDEAAFSLANVNDLSSIVETSYGYHIIKLTDTKPVQTKSLESVSADILGTLQRDKATTEFYELQATMAALAFELPDDLDELSETLEQPVETSEMFSRTTAPSELSAPAVVASAFSLELIEEQVNSELIEISDEHVMVLRVEEHKPVRTLSFDEVKESVAASLTDELAFEQAEDWVAEVQQKLISGDSIEQTLTDKGIEWVANTAVERFSTSLAATVRDQAFKSAVDSYELISDGNTSVSLVNVTAVNQAVLDDDAEIENLRQRMVNSNGQRSLQSFIELLKQDADITRFE